MTLEDFVLASGFKARGQINKELIFYVVDGEQRIRDYVVPTDPQTPAQLSARAFWRNGMEYWHNESQTFRDNYNAKAKKYYSRMLGVNLFMRDWVREVYVMNVIKSMQCGQTNCSDGLNDITISSIDLTKSFALCNSFAIDEAGDGTKKLGVVGAYLLNATTLRIAAIKDAGASTPRAYWHVVEYY